MSQAPSLHLLSMDWDLAPSATRALLDFSREERIALLSAMAVDAALEVAIVARCSGLDFYVSGDDPTPAYRVVLRVVASRGPLSGFRSVRTLESSGFDAAQCLLRRASGLDSEMASGLRGLDELSAAAALAAEADTLGPRLASLFSHATSAVWKARQETRASRPDSTLASRELENLAVERIIEEELLSWQLLDERSPERSGAYPTSEPESMLRLKVGRELTRSDLRFAQNSA